MSEPQSAETVSHHLQSVVSFIVNPLSIKMYSIAYRSKLHTVTYLGARRAVLKAARYNIIARATTRMYSQTRQMSALASYPRPNR